ncbi:hypothetical protein V8E36_008516 [Tilletia maclaganii]
MHRADDHSLTAHPRFWSLTTSANDWLRQSTRSAAPAWKPCLAEYTLPCHFPVYHRLHELTDRALYTDLTLTTSHAFKLFVRTFAAQPTLARHVRSLAIYTSRGPFDSAHKLARLLVPAPLPAKGRMSSPSSSSSARGLCTLPT